MSNVLNFAFTNKMIFKESLIFVFTFTLGVYASQVGFREGECLRRIATICTKCATVQIRLVH